MKETIEFFDGDRATNYDNFIQTLFPGYELMIQATISALKLNLVDNANLLIGGCGTGNEMSYILDEMPLWNCVGVDPSPEMISQAKLKLESFENYELHLSTVSQLNTSINYDAATLLLVLHFIPDDGGKLELLKDLNNRLIPGAPLIICDIFGNKPSLSMRLKVLFKWIEQHLTPETLAKVKDRILNNIYHISETRLTELLIEAGFSQPIRFFQSSIYGVWGASKLRLV